jgi:hypothetical protein
MNSARGFGVEIEQIHLTRLVLDVLQIAGLIAVGVYTWFINRTKANRDSISRIDARVHAIEQRFERVETDIHHLPSHHEIAAVHEKINRFGKSLENLRGEVGGIGRTLTLIHQSLLEERHKS